MTKEKKHKTTGTSPKRCKATALWDVSFNYKITTGYTEKKR